MDENHRDKIGSTTTVGEDATWVFNGKSQLWVPKHSKSGWLRRGFKDKTSWDWLQLLLQLLTALTLPVALFLGAQWFSAQQSQASLQIAADQQQETTLKTYLDDMSDLLLNHNLGKSKPGDEVSLVARERTLTTLRRLEANRNRIALQFLQDAHLIGMKNAVIDLSYTDLSGDDLSGANLFKANLSGATITQEQLATTQSPPDATMPTGNSPTTPDITLSDFCLLIQEHAMQYAYQLYSPNLQKAVSVSDFAQMWGNTMLSSCKSSITSSYKNSAKGTIRTTEISSGQTQTYNVTLISRDGYWLINSIQP